MNRKSFQALSLALKGLETFCTAVQRNSGDTSLASDARENMLVLQSLKAQVDSYFVNESRDAKGVRPPDAEIFREPHYKEDVFGRRPIFIIGSKRSGTTLLAYLLNTCQSICSLPENYFVGHLALSDNLFYVGHRMMTDLGEPLPRYLIRLGQLADELYSEYAAKFSKVRWVSKEVNVPQRLDLMDAMFDYRAQFIYIVRHGFNVAHSCSSRFPGRDGMPLNSRTSLDLETYLEEWIANSETTMDFHERNPSRCFFLRYEDLVSNPKEVASKVFQFLGETWDDELLDKMEQQDIPGMGDNKILQRGARIAPTPDVWRGWPDGLKRTLGRKANSTLERLGYDPVT